MNRFLNLLAFVCFSTTLFTRVVDPVIPQIASALSVEPATAALLSTGFALPYALIQPVLGALADTLSKTRLMTICMVVMVVASVIGGFATDFHVLMVSRVIAGLAGGGVFPIALAIAGDRVPVAQRQVAIGRLLFAAMSGNLLGAFGAGVIGDLIGWRGVFFVTALIGLIGVIAAVRGFRGSADAAPGRFDLSSLGPNYRTIFSNRLAKICFGAVFFEAIFLFGIFPHMAALLQSEGEMRASIAGLVIAGFGIGGIIYTFMVSWLLAHIGERRLMLSGGAVMAFCLTAIALRLSWPLDFAIFILAGFGFYLLHGCIQVYASELAPAARGSAMALHSAFFFFGHAAGPVIYGAGLASVGLVPVLLIGAAVVLLTGFICAQRLRRPAISSRV